MLAEFRLKTDILQAYQPAKFMNTSLKDVQAGWNSLFKIQIQMSTHRKYFVEYAQIL